MKYAIIIPDGCADEPQDSLGGRTPLQAAELPAMDAIASAGVVGRSNNVPASLPAGSDVANMSLLGYDPHQHYTGRAPLEATAQGIQLGANDWAIRCNLVTIEDQVMRSFTADHISSDDSRQLLAALSDTLDCPALEFVPGVSYRNLLIYYAEKGHAEKGHAEKGRGENETAPFSEDTRSTPPHDLTDKSVINDYPRGPGSDLLNQLMSDSVAVFANHEVNQRRVASGKLPATNIWLWGQGRRPDLRLFADIYGRQGTMITAVDLLRGIAVLIGWKKIEVAGATGYTDTDYAAKGRAAVEALAETDIICVHVEAPDEASHEGDVEAKITALEQIDRHIVGPLHAALDQQGDFRILVSPDHPTPLRTKTHSHGAVPFAIAGTGVEADGNQSYDDVTAAASDLAFAEGWKLMKYFLDLVES